MVEQTKNAKADEQEPVPVSQILLVDDPESCGDLRKLLEEGGYHVRVGADGGQARSLANAYKPDMIILELVLPRESGFELCDFFKKREDSIPLLVLTEVDLDSSRNLAIWCGADGYLIKPVSKKTILKMVREVAEAVWRRRRAGAIGIDGKLEFPCGCGNKIAVKVENAGRAIHCPRCQKMIIIPKNVNNWEGFWKSHNDKAGPSQGGKAGEAEKSSEEQMADFFCHKCGAMVQLRDYDGSGKIPCSECGEPHVVPKRILEQLKFFFMPREKDAGAIRFNPTRGIGVRCQSCKENFSINADELRRGAVCPNCNELQTSPSIRDSPLSRAALASTGRMFVFTNGADKGKKFLIPPTGVVKIGSDPACHVVLQQPGVEPLHCAMRYMAEGIVIKDAGSKTGTYVNEQRVKDKVVVLPGDDVQIGSVHMRLAGNRTLSEEEVFQMRSKGADEGGGASVSGGSRIGEQAAKILQLHWERQREALRSDPARAPKKPAPPPAPVPPVAAAEVAPDPLGQSGGWNVAASRAGVYPPAHDSQLLQQMGASGFALPAPMPTLGIAPIEGPLPMGWPLDMNGYAFPAAWGAGPDGHPYPMWPVAPDGSPIPWNPGAYYDPSFGYPPGAYPQQ